MANKCSKCQKEIEHLIGDFGLYSWLKLMNYFEHARCEGDITDITYDEMTNALMSFKPNVIIKPEGK